MRQQTERTAREDLDLLGGDRCTKKERERERWGRQQQGRDAKPGDIKRRKRSSSEPPPSSKAVDPCEFRASHAKRPKSGASTREKAKAHHPSPKKESNFPSVGAINNNININIRASSDKTRKPVSNLNQKSRGNLVLRPPMKTKIKLGGKATKLKSSSKPRKVRIFLLFTLMYVVCVCFLPIHSGHKWTYQPGSHRRKVTQDFLSTFLLRCVP